MVSYAREPVLLGDDAADGLMAYASRLSSLRLTENIQLRVLTLAGAPAAAGFMLTPGAPLMTLSHECEYPEPDNVDQVAFMLGASAGGVAALLPEPWNDSVIFSETDFDPRFERKPW